MEIRNEQPGDEVAISKLIDIAFAGAEHSDGTEAAIVDRLRDGRVLTLSLVAVEAGEIVGHAAFSPVIIDGKDINWLGLGPIAVHPDRQNSGIGSALIHAGLTRLRGSGAAGCVVLGEPAYYSRFGFEAGGRLRFPGPGHEYFQAVAFIGEAPSGTVAYHPAFG